MKKHLIAVAVAAAVAVPAVAQVSVSGTIDVSAQRTNKLTERAASATVQTQTNTTNTGGGNGGGTVATGATTSADGWATSELIFQATEDLGGGLKATARFSQTFASDSFAQRDKYIDVAGGFGSVRLGRFNPAIGGYNAYSGAGSTSPGGDLNHMTTGNARVTGTQITLGSASFERNNGLIQFTTPSFSGLTVNALYGDNSTDLTSTANRVTESKMQGFGAAYTAGPLKVEFASGQRKNKTTGVVGTRATAFFFNSTSNNTATQTTAATAAVGSTVTIADTTGNTAIAPDNFTFATTGVTPGSNVGVGRAVGIITTAGVTAVEQLDATHDFDWLGASYNLGPATVMASHSRRQMQSNTTTTTARATLNDIKINSVGLMVPMGATTLRVSTYTGKDERTTGNADDVKLSGQQISATYSLSKRTYFYAAMGESDVKRDTAGGTAAERKEKTTGLGLVHSF